MADAIVPKRAAVYARVSTKQHGQDPMTQILPLREYAERRGFHIVDEYVDIGISGSKERRPALDRLMADARRAQFNVVLVWRFQQVPRLTPPLLYDAGE